MIKIAFFNRKGGTGKTTTVVNIAAVLNKYHDKKILVVDCDSQRTATEYLLSFAEKDGKTIEDCINGDVHIKDAIVQMVTYDKCDEKTLHGIYVLPSSVDLETVSIPKEDTIKSMLASVEDEFDYCLFDMPPAINEVALGSLIACDYVIVPAIPDTDSMKGFEQMMKIVKDIRQSGANPSLTNLGILFNNVIFQRIVQKNVLTSTKEQLPGLCFRQHIKAASVIEQARYFGIPITEYSSSHEIVNSYRSLVKEILEKIKKSEIERKA